MGAQHLPCDVIVCEFRDGDIDDDVDDNADGRGAAAQAPSQSTVTYWRVLLHVTCVCSGAGDVIKASGDVAVVEVDGFGIS